MNVLQAMAFVNLALRQNVFVCWDILKQFELLKLIWVVFKAAFI
jgi:hypothetical protein